MNRFSTRFSWMLAVLAIVQANACTGASSCPTSLTASRHERGQFGASLSCLKQFYTPARTPGESNYYIDMWAGPKLCEITAANGLTNNHALFINSHGKGIAMEGVIRYAFYPHNRLVKPGQAAPCFSVADLAAFVGPSTVEGVHNVIIAGCDEDACFDSAEVRRHFPNATNITHVAAGEKGYQPMFVQSFLTPSAEIRPQYELSTATGPGRAEYSISHTPASNATRFSPYVAELFRPGAMKPFAICTAGREILSSQMERADAPAGEPTLSAR